MVVEIKNRWIGYSVMLVQAILIAVCLSAVCYNVSSLPSDILDGQWKWLYGCGIWFTMGMVIYIILFPKAIKQYFAVTTSWIFILYGFMEAVWGIRQVYGFTYSNHSLYALTGSFYNPGPYSGYLAMIFPICLYEWLKRKEGKKTIPYYVALAVMLLILCVLPAGMSRSAWIAAAVSSIYVCGMHYKMEIQHYIRHHRKQAVSFAIVTFILGGIALGGIYQMKKDSADGRLFMWKIAAQAVSEHPWTGCGWNSVPAAYGQAQEDYFATGNYSATEELVAGSPEYVFNEYLQVAIAWGIPLLCIGLLILGGSMYIGHKQGIYGLCGALLSLAVFAFSSYPLQFPAFVSALIILVLACGIRVLPLEKVWPRILFTVLLLIGSYGCFCKYQQKSKTVEACKQWTKSRMFYHSGAYRQAVESYAEIQKEMKGNARFMFEYGHALHKLHEPELSNKVLKEALKVSGDPMILNIIGKNEQEMKHYDSAEYWFMRAVHRLPGRIYPYYLLANLYADPFFYRCDKLERMVQTVLEKEPKIQSTAIKQMRRKARELLKKVPEN